METQEALRIMRALADGLSPQTGEALAADSIYQIADNVRAMHRAVGALEFVLERDEMRKALPPNAGKSWTHEEDQQVCDELRRGTNFQQIAKAHNRTVGAILARLVKLGKITAKPSAPKAA